MAKKKKIFNYLFPILCIVFPLIAFLVISVVKYISSGIFNYSNNFVYFYDCLKNIKEYIFPSILFFTIGLAIVVIFKFASKKITTKLWLLIVFLGIFIILLGNRFLFIISNDLWNQDIFTFLYNGITPYTFILSSELMLLICSVLNYFNSTYLK